MGRRRRKMKERRKDIVVFLDANISPTTSLHIEDLRSYAHWVSFGAFPEFPEKRNGGEHCYHAVYQKVSNFFDLTGDQNFFEKEGVSPHRMKDDELLSYMARLMEKLYPSRRLYLFYTHDKRFFTQSLMKDHPQLFLFSSGKLVYVPLDTPREKGRSGETTGAIRKDFLERLDELAL